MRYVKFALGVVFAIGLLGASPSLAASAGACYVGSPCLASDAKYCAMKHHSISPPIDAVNYFVNQSTPEIAYPQNFPCASAVARLYKDGQAGSTGSLFLNPRLLLTTSHSVMYDNGILINSVHAHFQCLNGKSISVNGQVVKRGAARQNVSGRIDNVQDDWALVVLDTPVDSNCTHPLEAFSSDYVGDLMHQNNNLALIGYSVLIGSGKYPSIAKNCSVLGMTSVPQYGFIRHCCGSFHDSSGGPILAQNDASRWCAVAAIDNFGLHKAPGSMVCDMSHVNNSNGAVYISVFRRQAERVNALLNQHLSVVQIKKAMESDSH